MIDFRDLGVDLLELESDRLITEDIADLEDELLPRIMLEAARFSLSRWSAGTTGDGPATALGYAVAAEAEAADVVALKCVPPLTELVAKLADQTAILAREITSGLPN